jgi:gamma-polyglutamate biosynthesis protein CapC
MTAIGMTAEMAVLGIALGLVLSLGCYLVTNLSPGGMITPGWLAITLVEDPARVGGVVGIAGLTWAGTLLLQRVMILFGKRLFATVVLLGVLLQMSLVLLMGHGSSTSGTHQTLGFIVPGLISYQLVRQPRLPTVVATASVTVLAFTILMVGVLLHLLPV